jgi:hypothetical protein
MFHSANQTWQPSAPSYEPPVDSDEGLPSFRETSTKMPIPSAPYAPNPSEEEGFTGSVVPSASPLVGRSSLLRRERTIWKTLYLCLTIILKQLIALFQNYEPKDFVKSTGKGGNCYIDMGELYGNWVMGNAMSWWPLPVCIDQEKVDAFLSQIFLQLQKDGIRTLSVSFAQIADIEHLLNGTAGSPEDTITPIFSDGYLVGTTGKNFLQYFSQSANAQNIQVNLSFGGADATPADMQVSNNPVQQAQDLARFMAENNLLGVDFDLEGQVVVTVGSDPNALQFFQTLHTQLQSQNKRSAITLAGSLQDGPLGPLKTLFANFNSCFDQVNLMMYSTSQYYLDANNVTWGLQQWIEQVGGDPSKLSIGFYDSIPYEDPAASAGQQYNIPAGLTRGAAAAWVYKQVCTNLGLLPSNFAPPFWWTDNPMNIPDDQVLFDFNTALGLPHRSLQDNPVYDQFLIYWNNVNTQIDALRGNAHYGPNQKAVEQYISEMLPLQNALASIEQQDINSPLAKFEADCAPTITQINGYYQAALNLMNGSPDAQAIQADYQNAQGLIAALSTGISKNQAQLVALSGQQGQIAASIPQLQKEVDAISDPGVQAQAQALLNTLIAQNQQLSGDIGTAQPLIAALAEDLSAIQEPGSPVANDLTALQQLASLANPTDQDVTQADQLVLAISGNATYVEASGDLAAFVAKNVPTLNGDIAAVQATLAKLNALLPSKRTEIYSDNWAIPDGNLPMPNIPTTAAINYAFGEPSMAWSWGPDPQNPNRNIWQVNPNDPSNGSWIANFPGGFPVDPANIVGKLLPRMPDALSIGGWNTSQPNPGFDVTNPTQPYAYQQNNLFQIMTSANAQVRTDFINTIVSTVSKDGYKAVIMDYENYSGGHQEGNNYTQFLKDLWTALQALNPPVALSMAMSPAAKNQNYYDINELIADTGIIFEVMNYDYGLGLANDIVTPNAGVGQTLDYLHAMVAAGVPSNRMKFGFSTYGLGFNLPYGVTFQDVLSNLKQPGGQAFASYWSGQCPKGTANGGNGQIDNDQIFGLLGSGPGANPWQPDAASGWQAISYHNPNQPDYPAEVLYYHPTAGNNGCPIVISAQTGSPVSAVSTSTGQSETVPAALVTLVTSCNSDPQLSSNRGFFGWDAMEDENSVALNAVLAADQASREE